MIACDRNRTEKYYVLKIDYAQVLTRGTANLTIYYSDPIDDIAAGQSGYALMPDGRVMVAGGIYNSNSTAVKRWSCFLFMRLVCRYLRDKTIRQDSAGYRLHPV